MAGEKLAPLFGVAACCLLLAAVSLNDYSKEVDLEAAAKSAALVQTGKGLSLAAQDGKWDVSASKGDARLSDQIAGWTKSAGKGKPTPARTEELSDTDLAVKPSLKQKMHTAADSLRLSDFLSGVSPATTQTQVESLYQQLDPKDATGWKERYAALDPKPTKKAQVKEISHFQAMLQHQLSTTPYLDSPKAQKVRSELKELLKKRAELKEKIEKREEKEEHGPNYVPRKANADEDDDLLKSLSRTEDSRSTYQKWLKDASGELRHQAGQRSVKKPVITAGGQLRWKGSGAAEEQARLRAAHARLQTLSQRTKKQAAQGERKQRSGPNNVDLIEEAQQEADPVDSWESIQQRAAHKVDRWMGGGYVKVYDLGSGR